VADPLITFSGAIVNVVESSSGSPQLTFEVVLSEPASSTVAINYRTLPGEGTALGEGVDYFEETSSVSIAAGQTSATFNITVQDLDDVDEADESVVVELFNPSNAVFPDGATTLRATGVILDDDGVGNDRSLLVSSLTVTEDASGTPQAVFEVRLSEPSATAITLDYTTSDGSALAGQDYTATSGSLTFAAGEVVRTVAVPLVSDAVAEANEFFNLVFTPTAAIANGIEGAVGTATIIDDDTNANFPEISISGGQAVESANGSPQLEFTVRLSEPASSTVAINYRTLPGEGTALGEGVDYFEETSSVSIAAGQTSATFNITVQDLDDVDEADESVVVELFNPSNAVFPDGVHTLQSTGFTLDDDGVGNKIGVFVENAQIVEGADGVVREVAVPITLSRPLDQDLTLSFTTAGVDATAGADFVQTTGTVTFLAGETKTAALIPVIGDSVIEPDEAFTLTIAPTGDTANGTDGATGVVTIIDGGVPGQSGVEMNVGGAAAVNEGGTVTRTVTFVDDVDTGSDGWTYEVDWDGDGNPDETGSVAPAASSFDISHLFPDGDNAFTADVTLLDQGTDLDTQSYGQQRGPHSGSGWRQRRGLGFGLYVGTIKSRRPWHGHRDRVPD